MNKAPHKPLTALAVTLAEGWTPQADKWQHLIPFDNPTVWNDFLARGVKAGNFELLHILYGGKAVGILCYRVDVSAARELVIIAAYCDPIPGEDVASFICKISETLGKQRDCQSVRFHTLRPGLIQKTIKEGFRVAEIVLRKTLKNNV